MNTPQKRRSHINNMQTTLANGQVMNNVILSPLDPKTKYFVTVPISFS
jgi:hypothetical protein